jgi:apolipoprotein N-acyltransferase
VENGVSVVRAGNSALSCVIDPRGKAHNLIQSDTGEIYFVKGYSVSPVWFLNKKTFYYLFGNLFVYLCLLFAVVYALTPFKKRM